MIMVFITNITHRRILHVLIIPCMLWRTNRIYGMKIAYEQICKTEQSVEWACLSLNRTNTSQKVTVWAETTV